MTCAQGLLRLLWGGRSWSATGLPFLSDTRSFLATLSSPSSFFYRNSLAHLAETVFSILLHYQATIGPYTIISPWERRS